MKCIECNRRKGKRPCPALGRGICAKCCGEKRVLKINCTPECRFLASGQSYLWGKKYVAMFENEPDPKKKRKLYQTTSTFFELLSQIERVVVEYSLSLSSLDDRDILEAIQLVQEAYRTERRGVIYEPTSSNPLAEGLVKELKRFFEAYREDQMRGGDSLRIDDLIDCLDVVEADINHHLNSTEEPKSYLHFVLRSHPDLQTSQSKGGIVIAPS